MGDIREKIRKPIRARRIGSSGPLYVPPELKEEGFEYYWQIHSPQNAFSLMEAKSKGWTFVPSSHLNKLGEEMLGDESLGLSYKQGDYIACPAGGGATLYLMRIPSKLYQENLNEDDEARRARRRAKDKELETKPGVYKKHEIYNQ